MSGNGDPRLTAYALGECDDAEREAVEALLAADPAARAEVEEIRAAAGTLAAALSGLPLPSLEAGRRAALERAVGGSGPAAVEAVPASAPASASVSAPVLLPGGKPRRARPLVGAAAAATLLGMAFGVAGYTVGMERVEVRSPDDVTFVSNFGQATVTTIPRNHLLAGPEGSAETASRTLAENNAPLQERLTEYNSLIGHRLSRGLLFPSQPVDSGGGGGGGGGGLLVKSGNPMGRIKVFRRSDGKPGYYYYGAAGGGGAGGSLALHPNERLPVDGSTRSTISGTLPATLLSLRSEEGVAIGAVVNQGDDDVFFDPRTLASVGYLGMDESTTESSAPIVENPWIRPVGEAALSTFSVDVDTAGYSIVRRCLTRQGRLPPPAAVRIEELVNYFPWDYAPPSGADPFAVHVEAASCPWEPRHRLVRIALKGRVVEEAVRPAANLVFLLDVSGSMNQPNKLPLVKESLRLLAGRLDARDRVAIVVYAGASGLALPSTAGNDESTILHAIDNLSAGGSTNGGAGIELAYKVAAENFVPGGINRVVLATDGDFNVGTTSRADLATLIEEKAKSKVFLTALGYGMDNLKDDTLEQLADRGNGNYGYVDDLAEARRILVDQGMSTLHAIAKDVKIQVEFNPAQVAGYRLLGYENRVLAAQDFADDRKDAGEIGAGHAVTAFYEVVPAGEPVPGSAVDELRYQRPGSWSGSLDTLTVKLRWKEPEGDVSALREVPFTDGGGAFDGASEDFRFAAAVAEWGLLLRGSKNAGSASFAAVREIAAGAMGRDEGGWKAEFLLLVPLSESLRK